MNVMPAAGTKIGPYEILSAIGAGGMGEVYRARDPRIGREVAIKLLPEQLSGDADRLRRFEQEARSAGQLNHPNILAIFDAGTDNGTPFIVSELLQGETLRKRISEGALNSRKAVDFALQIATGLTAAHERGIVHRDLKPENVFVTKEGRIKILDFGLAKLTHAEAPASEFAQTATISHQTETGAILGTIVYMSPEQVRGLKVDHRSDIFAFGALLYEMLTGKRPFGGDSQVEVMHAILKADPPEMKLSGSQVSPALERIVQRCLEKDPVQRFQSTRDLAFALEALSGSSIPTAADRRSMQIPFWKQRMPWLLIISLLAIAALSYLAGNRLSTRHDAVATVSQTNVAPFILRQLTFRRGYVNNARFAPDSQTVLYDANWSGRPGELFFTQIGSPESRSLMANDTALLAVSSKSELAVTLAGSTLARMSFTGGAPREIERNITGADWTPDGANLAIIRNRKVLEFPVGKVLYRSNHIVFKPRFSPSGDQIAFLEMRTPGIGSIYVADLTGKVQKLVEQNMQRSSGAGLSWTPSGKEIWFTADARKGSGTSINAVQMDGKYREILPMDGMVRLCDISKDGRVLVTRGTSQSGMSYSKKGSERDLTWFDNSAMVDISDDGRTVLFTEEGEAAASLRRNVYLRNVDSPEPVRLGDGTALGLSPDGSSVLACLEHSLILLPTGPGQQTKITNREVEDCNGYWFPDGQRVLFYLYEANGPRLYIQDVKGGNAQPAFEAGPYAIWSQRGFSPDGKWIIGVTDDEGYFLLSYPGGERKEIPTLQPEDNPIRFDSSGRYIYVERDLNPMKVFRIDLVNGTRELLREIVPPDPAGITKTILTLTPDANTYAYSYSRVLSDLYVLEGLK